MGVANVVVRWLLRSPLHRLLSRSLMVIEYEGRRSGRRFRLPVGYVRHEGSILVLVSRADTKTWWRNFREPRAVRLRIAGEDVSGTARLADVFDVRALRMAYVSSSPRAAKAFRVPTLPDGTPDPDGLATADLPVIVVDP